MIPMGSESCEWPFVGQNKNFAELNEKMQNISFGFSINTIKTISSRTETYTAVQDCWCVGRIKGGSADPCGIILDDVLLFNLDATSYVPVVIPIKKGQKISIKGNATLCSLNFYESLKNTIRTEIAWGFKI